MEEKVEINKDLPVQYSTHMKMKWWFWLLLILGLVMIIGGIIYVIVV